MRTREFLNISGKNISYIDYGGKGFPIIALHGHFGNANMFSGIAKELGDKWRVIAIDQQGHGWSDRSKDYSRDAYIKDIVKVTDLLKLKQVILYGHSLGGVNAYQIAARYAHLVKAMVIEDIGALNTGDLSFLLNWPDRFSSIREAKAFLHSKGMADDTYFLESLREDIDGWGFQFNYKDMVKSQELLNGDYWSDWLASDCPALLLHGHKTWVMTTEHAKEMAAMRPNTRLVEFPEAGHSVRDDDPEGVYSAVKEFLSGLTFSR
ncbi:MAG: alpha/beta hydrolase [Bacteroidales bacterium]|nr:alpha/beta hydrolase [Bacteroidales bacterium]